MHLILAYLALIKNNSSDKVQDKNGSLGSISETSDTSDKKAKSVEPSSTISYNDVEEFFRDDEPFTSSTDHSLEQSPCFHIIGSRTEGGRIWYYCKLHPKVVNTNLNSIEHHCKYSDHVHHKEAILRILRSFESNSGSNSILMTDLSVEDQRAKIGGLTRQLDIDNNNNNNNTYKKLKINPKYEVQLRGLTPCEYKMLRNSIQMVGQRVPIIADKDGNIIDGHHRFKICMELELSPNLRLRTLKARSRN